MKNLITKAARFASLAHFGQFRKYGHSHHPYVWHPMRVAGLVSMHIHATDEMVAAAWLHDTKEDCGVTHVTLVKEFGREVADLVLDLTNPSKDIPLVRRAERKKMDREHIASLSWNARFIKLVDRLDNLREMHEDVQTPGDFKRMYKAESKLLLEEALTGVDDALWVEAMSYAE